MSIYIYTFVTLIHICTCLSCIKKQLDIYTYIQTVYVLLTFNSLSLSLLSFPERGAQFGFSSVG